MSQLVRRIPNVAGLVGIAAILGCGPRSTAPPPVAPQASAAPASEDLTAEMQKVALTGTLFRPTALAEMDLVPVRSTRKVTLDQQRAAWKRVAKNTRAPLASRATEAQVLASLLWKAGTARPGERPKLLTEAAAAFAELQATAAGKLDATSLEMAAAVAQAAGDRRSASRYLDELFDRLPATPAAGRARAQRAFHQLEAGDDAGAAAAVNGLTPTADAPELAYVIAWSRFRARDLGGAAAAIALAITGWRSPDQRQPVLRDFLIITARAGVAPADAAATIAALDWSEQQAAATRDLRYHVTSELAQAYGLAGRPALARAAIDLALGVAATAAPPAEVVAERLEQAEYAWRAGAIAELGDAWQAARGALDACAAACTAEVRKAFGDALSARAVELHTVFATTGDRSYRDAARTLYEQFATLPDRADAVQVARYARDFAAVKPPDTGAQYAEGLAAPLSAQLQEIAACYDEVLQGERTVGGALTLKLEIDQGGLVTGAATDPASGETGLAAVARCVEARARAWHLPSRPRPGVARISTIYELNPPPSS